MVLEMKKWVQAGRKKVGTEISKYLHAMKTIEKCTIWLSDQWI